MEKIVSVNNLKKNFQGDHALKGVSFSIPECCLFGIIGPDGAGKTTLLQILATLIQPDEGDAFLLSNSIKEDFRKIRRNIGYMPQRFSLYEDLSVMENLVFFADIFGIKGSELRERLETLFSFSHLKEFKDRRAGKLSGGMKQKLALCCALIHEPQILILDEPTVGVDPVSREEFWEIIKKQNSNGMTVIISTPYMNEASYCKELILIDKGNIVLSGAPEKLCSEYPLNLYSLDGEKNLLSCLSDLEHLDELDLVYPCNGKIHIASQKMNSIEKIRGIINGIMPEILNLKHIKPDIEDIFIYTLLKRDKFGLTNSE